MFHCDALHKGKLLKWPKGLIIVLYYLFYITLFILKQLIQAYTHTQTHID